MSERYVHDEIAASNPWYTGDQFQEQFHQTAFRAVLENRWSLFGREIDEWAQSRDKEVPVRVLDAGCGDGINLHWLSKALQLIGLEFDLYGLDYNGLRIDRATRIPQVNSVVNASLLAMPFDDQVFDLILCNHVLEHIDYDNLALAELRRLLSFNGLLILGVPNEGCTLARLRNRFLQPTLIGATDHVQFYTARSLVQRMQIAGFDILRVRANGFFFPHTRLFQLVQNLRIGQIATNKIGRLLPSQAAEIIAIAKGSQS